MTCRADNVLSSGYTLGYDRQRHANIVATGHRPAEILKEVFTMISYADITLRTTIEKDRFGFGGFGTPTGDTTTWLASPQLDRGLQVKSVVNPHAFLANGGDATPGTHAWRPPDW